MAGGVEHSGEHGLGATVHCSMNREHREMEGVLANTSRPRRWPEGKAEAAVAMVGIQERSVLATMALEATKLKLNAMWR